MTTFTTDTQDTAKELFGLLSKYGMTTKEVACAGDLTRQALCWGELGEKLDQIPDMIRDLRKMADLADALASNLYVHADEQVDAPDENEDPKLVDEYQTLTRLGMENTLTPAQADRRMDIIEELGW